MATSTMAHYDIFRDQLAIRFPAHGYALWEPDPGDLYQVVGIGDVGYINEGRFHRLFNILLPADDPSHENFGVPDNHEQFKPKVPKHVISGILRPDNFSSAGVTLESDEHGQFATRPRDPGEVSFSCRGKQGAVLSLPVQAKRENTVLRKDFGKWMIEHISVWFAWVRDKGLEIDRMEDIVLVTGTDRARSWANVAFLGGQADARVSFGVDVAQSRINWQFSSERKVGAAWNWGPSGENLPDDQCIFIRGFRVARKRMIFWSKLKAAAGPNPDPKDDDCEPDAELISIPTVPKYRDPLHVMLEYLAEERHNCDTVIVHDDDLALLDVIGDGTSVGALRPDVVLSCLRNSKPVIREVLLRPDISSGINDANADTEIVMVASLSRTFEGQFPRLFDSESGRIIAASSLQSPVVTSELPTTSAMSLPLHAPTSSSPHVKQVLDVALSEYKKQTRKDLLGNNAGGIMWIQMKRDVLEWLTPSDPSVNYNIARKAYQKGTAVWFFESNKFKEWELIGSLIWIHGKPGSGKSVLCAAIITHVTSLRDAGLAALAYYYFDFRDEEKKTPRSFVASILTQLSAYSEPCCDIIFRLYSAHEKGAQQPSTGVLINCLKEVLKVVAQQPAYIIIDALDECPNTSELPTSRAVLLDLLKDLVDLHIQNLHICVTSRLEADIKTVLEPLGNCVVLLHDESGQQKDISDYVRNAVYSDGRMRRWRDEYKEFVVENISEKVDGMFRWAFCQLEMLQYCLPQNLRQFFSELRETLDETYERILKEIPSAKQEHAYRLLQCITVALRPLRVEELAEVLAFECDTAQGAVPRYRADWRPNDPVQAVLSTCSSLVTIVEDHGSQVVRFSHFSVKQFLTSPRLARSHRVLSQYYIVPRPAHTILAQACLGVLHHMGDHVDEESIKDSPLAKYAAEHWVTHAQFEDTASYVKDEMEALFDCDKPSFAAWVGIYNIDEQSYGELPSKMPTPLYYSSLCGFSGLVEHLAIKHPQHVNAMAGRYQFPLHAALVGKHVRVMKILLEHGANVNIRGMTGRTPLHEAIGDLGMVQFLLKNGADVNCQRDDLRTPLHLAASRGDLRVARELLEHKAIAGPLDGRGNTPLHLLFEDNDRDVPNLAQLLIEHGADVNRRNQDNNTPLHLAMGSWMYKCAGTLLEHGAEVNVGNNESQTPLHLLFENGYSDEDDLSDIARLLIEHGADVNIRAMDKWAPLHWAAFDGRLSIASLLVDHGARVHAENEQSEVPLLLVSQGNYKSQEHGVGLVQLLLEHNADVNSRAKNKWSPLHWAAFNGRLEITQVLLDHGANVNAENDYRETPLHLVSAGKYNFQKYSADITSLLLERGADTNARDKDHATPFHWAAFLGRLEIALVLLDHGADANAKNDQGETPLHLVSRGKYDSQEHGVSMACLLLERGVDANARMKNEWTPLHSAAFNGKLKVVGALLEQGANANAENDQGETPLHLVSRSNYISEEVGVGIAELLFEYGSDRNARDRDNETPLQLARYRGKLDIARVLLDHNAKTHPESEQDLIPSHLGLEERSTEKKDHAAPLHQA